MPGSGTEGTDPIAGRDGKAAAGDGQDAELYRLAGEIVCVEQGVANRVEMCVAHMRNEAHRDASVALQGSHAREALGAGSVTPLPGRDAGAPGGIPGRNAGIGEKVRYLRQHWRVMEGRRPRGVSDVQFAGYVMDADASRNTVAHCTVVRYGSGVLTNVREGRECDAAELGRLLGRIHRALGLINRLCAHMGLDDYAGYVRYVRRRGARRAAGGGR